MNETVPTPEQVRAALLELLVWQGISRSPQLADLLRYVVEKTLAGEESSIKAYTIAVDVFGRPQDFDPQSDPIVRVQARRLRALLDEHYASGEHRSRVEIRLPLGRYVPEFSFAGAAAQAVMPVAPGPLVEGEVLRRPFRSRFLVNVLLGLSLTLAGAALAVSLLRWRSDDGSGGATAALPQTPRIAVGSFENLTGEPALNDEVEDLTAAVSAALARFEDLTVANDAGQADVVVSGAVQEEQGRLQLRAVLTQPSGGIRWNSQIEARVDGAGQPALDNLVSLLVRQLGSPRGPIDAPGRAWLAQQAVLPDVPNLYACQLKFDEWRETRTPADAVESVGCFQRLLEKEPGNALALAGSAGISSWLTQRQARPGDQLIGLLSDENQTIRRAAQLLPTSSFVFEQRAQVQARLGLSMEAMDAVTHSLELNPNNTDALMTQALYLMLTGDWDRGAQISEDVLTTVPSPPPFYYMPRAFNALRERRYFDAVDAAQAFGASADEIAPVLLLAAAPYVSRDDLVARTRAAVLANTDFQKAGILPRISIYLRQQIVLERIREGLILGGIPANALDGPFNADGTPKAD